MKIEKNRLGWFFLFVGMVLWVIFFTTDQSRDPSYGYFFMGAAALFVGGGLMWSARKPPAETARFRTVRRIRQKRAERKSRKNHE